MDETRVATPRHQVQLKKRSHHKKPSPRVKVYEAKPFPEERPTSERSLAWLHTVEDLCRLAREDGDVLEHLRQGLLLVASLTAAASRERERVRDPRLLRTADGVCREVRWLTWTGHTPS